MKIDKPSRNIIKISFSLALSCMVCFIHVFGQTDTVFKRCGSTEMRHLHGFDTIPHSLTYKTDPDTVEDSQLYYIPVVFHIIYSRSGLDADKLSDAQIHAQMRVLNEDNSRKAGTPGHNNSPIGTDTKIRYFLATKNPNGNPTSGIERIQNSTWSNATSATEMAMKTATAWDQQYYYNIWVVTSIDANQGGVAGYSYLAEDASTPDKSIWEDGTVVNFAFVGYHNPDQSTNERLYWMGRTLTHESGHYCNMHHPWGDQDISVCGDDEVYDTPPCENRYFATYPSCTSPFQCGYYRLVADYMDYATDGCMNIFTKGQAQRMRASLRKYRPNLISCDNRIRTGAPVLCNGEVFSTNDVSVFPNPAPADNINFYVYENQYQDMDYYFFDNLGKYVSYMHVQNGNDRVIHFSLPQLRPGLYNVVIKGATQFYHRTFMIY